MSVSLGVSLYGLSSAAIEALIGGTGGSSALTAFYYKIKKRLGEEAAKLDEVITGKVEKSANILREAGQEGAAAIKKASEEAAQEYLEQLKTVFTSAMAEANTKIDTLQEALNSLAKSEILEVADNPTQFISKKASEALGEQIDIANEMFSVVEEGAAISKKAASQALANFVKAEEGVPQEEELTTNIVSRFFRRTKLMAKNLANKISSTGGD